MIANTIVIDNKIHIDGKESKPILMHLWKEPLIKTGSPEMHDGEQIGTVQFMQRMLSSFNHINGSEKEMETFMLPILDAPYSLSEYVIQRQLQK